MLPPFPAMGQVPAIVPLAVQHQIAATLTPHRNVYVLFPWGQQPFEHGRALSVERWIITQTTRTDQGGHKLLPIIIDYTRR